MNLSIKVSLFIFMTAPEAESDPRDYVLIPLKDLVEDSEENLPAEEVTNHS